jgi:mono/diheme cytochrome c family protein
MKMRRSAALAVIAVSALWGVPTINAQTQRLEGNAEAGRHLALLACTGCHIVASDQPFKPIYAGPPRPPDFKGIANQSNITAASLQHHLETLPTIPKDSDMANRDLTSQQIRDVVAFIITLRDKPATPAQ